MPIGKKRPIEKGWQRTTFEDTQRPEYEKELYQVFERGGNLGVLLGHGLCTIDVDDDKFVDGFLALNPQLTNTLRSRGARGCQLWLHIIGPYPQRVYLLKFSNGTEFGEFRAGRGQTVIAGVHPNSTPDNPVRYVRLVAGPAIQIAFKDIQWPAELILPWEKQIAAYMAAMPCSIAGSHGDLQLFKAASALVNGFGLDPAEALPYLQAYNARAEPPWSDDRLNYKLSEALQNPLPGKERGYLFIEAFSKNLKEKAITVNSTTSTNTTGPYTRIQWQTSTSSPNTTVPYTQKAIYPPDSLLEEWMQIGREQTEAADCFILGSILPVCAALLARKVRFSWGTSVKFPNLFTMLAGKAGDRKSSIINLARQLAAECLPDNAFLPESFSPESLFDEYDSDKGGRPDKLWMIDDANATLTDWAKMSNGERVATRFLNLYDCRGLNESYRRNQTKQSTVIRRHIPQTSTNLVFGATFNIACFQGQAIRAGLARRFLYYVACGHGRMIARPKEYDTTAYARRLCMINAYNVIPNFSDKADKLWADYQLDNRSRINEIDPRRESELSRLASAPMQALSVAMIFQACVAAQQKTELALIEEPVLRLAIEHVEHNLEAANFLDTFADRQTIQQAAEVLLAKIRRDYKANSKDGTILLQRSELTARYAPHPGRQGSWSPDDLFFRFIPTLERQGDAKLFEKKGKRETYAFRDTDGA
jgi:hypothetical protein